MQDTGTTLDKNEIFTRSAILYMFSSLGNGATLETDVYYFPVQNEAIVLTVRLNVASISKNWGLGLG